MSTIAEIPSPLAVALGDPAGIGPEIVAKSWARRRDARLHPFFGVGDPRSIAAVWAGPVVAIATPADAARVFDRALPVIPITDSRDVKPGEPTTEGARTALDSLELAVGLVREGAAAALVTAPVSKRELYNIGFTHPGQTEFVAERCGIAAENTAMMLVGGGLRTVPITIHIALQAVPDALSTDLIASRARVVARSLRRDFGIPHPRLAFAGLNPHAGEGGTIGHEELEIIAPALEMLRDEGIDAIGPLPADTMFHTRARQGYDAALCMYHDQALIPLKTLAFEEGVNTTLGLPIVRTSPDHGTAFAIAGHDKADPRAMIAALKLAGTSAARRALA